MELKTKLDSIERIDLIYILTGLLLIAVTAVGIQTQAQTDKSVENPVSVQLVLEKPNETVENQIDLTANSTVFDVINQTYSVEYKKYDFGYFITSIDGTAQNESHNWVYTVNNNSVNKAANNYVLEDEDNITFIYTSQSLY